MKKTISLLLSVVLVLGIATSLPLCVNAASVSDLTFTLNDDGKSYAVTACNKDASGELIIPDNYKGLPVTSIGWFAFSDCTKLTSITISSSVISIQVIAFEGCQQLKSINVDKNNTAYTSVDGVLFNKNKSVLVRYPEGKLDNEYTIPDSVINVGYNAFLWCEMLYKVVVSDSVKVLEHGAFQNCCGLTEAILGDGVTEISEHAFWNCYRLKNVVIPKAVTKIGESAFQSCITIDGKESGMSITEFVVDKENRAYCSVDGVLYNKDKTVLIQYPVGRNNKTFTVPSSVKEISNRAFENAMCLENIKITDNIVKMGSDVFYNTAYFNNSDNWSNGVIYLNNHLLKCDRAQMVKETYVVRAGTKTIANGAFYRCKDLKSVVLPEGLVYIGENAFLGCNQLNSIKIPSSVASLGEDSVGYIIPPETDLEYTYKICPNPKFKIYCKCNTEALLYAKAKGFDYEIEETSKHTSSDWITGEETDCTTDGYRYKKCTVCGKVLDEEKTLAKGHKPSEWIIEEEADCIFEGYKYKECTVCGDYLEEQIIPKTAHKSSDWIVDKVATVNESGLKHKECETCWKLLDQQKIPQLKCAKPKLKTIANTTSGVKITWGKVSGADSYAVYRKTGSKGKYSKLTTTTKTGYTDKSAKSGKKYYYYVKAVNEAGTSSASSSKSIYYLADTTLKTPKSTKSGVTLNWTQIAGADGYMVYRKTGSGDYKKIATVKGVKKVKYTDKSAKKGKTYTYKIKAYKSKTYSAYSNAKKIKDTY